jgi:hypothetical protein
MPIFLDRHDLTGLTATDIAEAHRKDLEVQGRYGVKFLTYWFDERQGTGFCLIDAPNIETAMRVHDEAHGEVAKDVIEVDLSAVQAFLGRISDPAPSVAGAKIKFDAALRAIMFTDIVDSTAMTARLGDARAVEMVRAHDAIVRRALKEKAGQESSIPAMVSWLRSPMHRPPWSALAPSSKLLKRSTRQSREAAGTHRDRCRRADFGQQRPLWHHCANGGAAVPEGGAKLHSHIARGSRPSGRWSRASRSWPADA